MSEKESLQPGVGSQAQFVDTSRAVQPESATTEHPVTATYQVPMLPPNEQAAFPESEQMLPMARFSYGGTDNDTSSDIIPLLRQLSTSEKDGHEPDYEVALIMQSKRMKTVDPKVLDLAIQHTLHGTAELSTGTCGKCGITEPQLRDVERYWDAYFKGDRSDCTTGTAILQVASLHLGKCKAEECPIAKYLPQLMPYSVKADDFQQRFRDRTVIGTGGFGIVYKVQCKLDKQSYAVKATRMDASSQEPTALREIENLAKLTNEGDAKGVVRYHCGWVQHVSDEECRELKIPASSSAGISARKPISGRSASDIASDIASQSGSRSRIRSAEESRSGRSVSDIDIQFVSHSGVSPLTEASGSSPLTEENQIMHKVLFIQMELCSERSLKTWLDETAKERNRSRRDILKYFVQILDALCYIHDQSIIHRDLKPSNAFFAVDGTLKIGDFGLSRDRSGSLEHVGGHLSKEVGTKMYWSPEMETGYYTFKTDVYSLGLMLYEMHHPVRSGMEKVRALKAAKGSNPPEEIKASFPHEAMVVQKMLAEAKDRPTANDIKASLLKDWTSAIEVLEDDSIPKEVYDLRM